MRKSRINILSQSCHLVERQEYTRTRHVPWIRLHIENKYRRFPVKVRHMLGLDTDVVCSIVHKLQFTITLQPGPPKRPWLMGDTGTDVLRWLCRWDICNLYWYNTCMYMHTIMKLLISGRVSKKNIFVGQLSSKEGI